MVIRNSAAVQRLALCSLLMVSCVVLLAGCGRLGTLSVPLSTTTTTTTTPTTPTSPSTPTPHAPLGTGYLYVVSDNPGPVVALAFPISSKLGLADFAFAGTDVSVDAAGNVYTLVGTPTNTGTINATIDEFAAADLTGNSNRTIIPSQKVMDVMTDSGGTLFVSQGTGIAVYGPTASGAATPDRLINGVTALGAAGFPIQTAAITVDSSDNLYVQNANDQSIAVFGPKDNGTVVPTRVIAGPLTTIVPGSYIQSMTTDAAGNLYVLCDCLIQKNGGPYGNFGMIKFAPDASGNVAPIASVTTSADMYPYTGGNGIAVDAAGTLYISAGSSTGTPGVYVFAPGSNGNVAPTSILTSSGWLDAPPSRMAVR
jgi:hypothetical protein